MNMRRLLPFALLAAMLLLAACARTTVPAESAPPEQEIVNTESEESSMKLFIGDTEVSVHWEDNESVDALRALATEAPLTVSLSMYGGFEQVGSLGTRLPRNDVQTVTEAGDIVLYAGNQIVVFYGSNSWAYTRLGKITGLSDRELTALLGSGDVTLTIRLD